MIWKVATMAAGLALSLCVSGTASALSLSSPDVRRSRDRQYRAGLQQLRLHRQEHLAGAELEGRAGGTKSFAITVYDPDAPTGSGFWHWVVFNIPAGATGLPKNAGDLKANLMPAGAVQSRTDFGIPGWGGPCPPKGDKPHHYIFTVFAVDIDHIDANADTSAAVVGFNLHFHTLAKARIVATYGRPK